MASCSIVRNDKGLITEVFTQEGVKSELFDAIHSNIFLGDTESSAKVLAKTYTEEIANRFKDATNYTYASGEPQLFLVSPTGQEYTSLEKLLIEEDGGVIKMGLKDPNTDEFIELKKFNTQATPMSRFITSNAQQGLLSTKRVLGKDGITRLQGKGSFTVSKLASARGVKFEAICELGKGNIKVNKTNGTIEMDMSDEYILVERPDGTVESLHITDLPEDGGNFTNKIDLIVTNTLLKNDPRPVNGVLIEETEEDTGLLQALKTFLSNMGFELDTLENYRKDYNTKYGEDPDINAIADITNKVVAIAEGVNLTEELLEEVAHIALEAYSSQNSIVGMLVNIHLTEEYAQDSELYREKYRKDFPAGELSREDKLALEEKVRKEIAGKILAKEIQAQFSLENKTPEQQDLIGKLQTLWNNFVAFIKGNYKGFQRQTFQGLNTRIAQHVLKQEMKSFQQDLSKNNSYYYDIKRTPKSEIETELKTARELYSRLYSTVLKKSNPQQGELDKVITDMAEVDMLSSIEAIRSTTENLLRGVERSLTKAEDATASGVPTIIDANQNRVFTTIHNQTIPLIEKMDMQLKEMLKTPGTIENTSSANKILEGLKTLKLLHSELNPRVETDFSLHSEMLIEAAFESAPSLTEEDKDLLREKMKRGLEDANYFQSKFGLMSGSSNLYIQLMHSVAAKMNININTEVKSIADAVLKEVEEKDLQTFEKSVIMKDAVGKDTNFLEAPMLFHEAELEMKINIPARIISGITNQAVEEVVTLLKNGNKPNVILTNDIDKQRYNAEFVEALKPEKELAQLDSYYAGQEENNRRADVAEETVASQKTLSRRRATLLQDFTNEQGKVDKTLMDQYEKEELNNISYSRNDLGNAYDSNGNIKFGIQLTKIADLTDEMIATYDADIQDLLKARRSNTNEGKRTIITVAPGHLKNDLDGAARAALDLSNLSLLYQSKSQPKAVYDKLLKAGTLKKTYPELTGKWEYDEVAFTELQKNAVQVSDEFLQNIVDIENSGESAYDFLDANSALVLNESYYNLLEENVTFLETAAKHISTIQNKQDRAFKEDLLSQYEELAQTKNNLLKLGRDASNPLEVRANDLEDRTRVKIVSIENELDEIRRELNIPAVKGVKKVSPSIKTVNAHYKGMLEESRKSEYDFAMDHMTINNKGRVAEFASSLEGFFNGTTKHIRASYQTFITEQKDSNPEVQRLIAITQQPLTEVTRLQRLEARSELKDVLKTAYARDNVASYFLKFEPIGYSEVIAKLKSGEIKTSALVKDKSSLVKEYPVLAYLDVRPDYTWTNTIAAEDTKNPRYQVKGIANQPNINKYINKAFFTKYGIDMKAWMEKPTYNLEEMKPTKNLNEFRYLQILTDLRKEGYQKKGDVRSNHFFRPQVSKTRLEKSTGFNLKEIWRSLSKNRADDKEYGEQLEGENLTNLGIKVIPKYYDTALEDSNALTDSTLMASLMDLKQSITYENRMKSENDFKALEAAIAAQKFSSGKGKSKILKEGQTSEYLKMAQESMDHTLYGIKQSRNFTRTIGGTEIDFTKMINNVQSFLRFSNLAWSPLVDATSFTTGVFNNAMDRATEDYYHKSSANLAFTQVTGMLPAFIQDTGKLSKQNMLNHIVEFLNMGDFEGKIKDSSFSRGIRFLANSQYALSGFANLPVGPRTVMAILNDYKWIPGQNRFLNWEEFQIHKKQTEKGIKKIAIESEWKKYTSDSVFENLTVTKQGISFNDKFAAKFESKAEADKAAKKLVEKLGVRARIIAQSADGTLNAEDQVAGQRDAITNLMMTHRGWLPILLSRRFKSRQFSIATSRQEEGHFNTLLTFAAKALKSPNKLGSLHEQLTLDQKKNIKRAYTEMAVWFGLIMAGVAMMAPDGDDDEASDLELLAQIIYLRTVSEVSTQQLLGISKAGVEILENPFVAIRTVKALEPVELVSDIATFDGASLGKRVMKNTIAKRFSQFEDLNETKNSFLHFNRGTLYRLSPENVQNEE